MLKHKLFLIILFVGFSSLSQSNGKFDEEVLKVQKRVTKKILIALQKNETQPVLKYFDEDIEDLDLKLSESVSEIEIIKKTSKVSGVIKAVEDRYLFLCTYKDEDSVLFELYIYFKNNDPNSKVIAFHYKKGKV